MSLYMSSRELKSMSTNHSWSNGHKTQFFRNSFYHHGLSMNPFKPRNTPGFCLLSIYLRSHSLNWLGCCVRDVVDQWGRARICLSDKLSQSLEMRRWYVQVGYSQSLRHPYNLGAHGFCHCPMQHFPLWLWLIWVIVPVAYVQIGY